MSSAHSFFLSQIAPFVVAALPLPSTTMHVLNGSTGTVPASLLSLGRVVMWRFCLGHLKAFETVEDSCCAALEAVHYNQSK